ncbi:MAG: hypothetical protein QOI63_921, partial [Thermoplasmata archaeon]|nr:hypothetical protein [Thermoplasmata archaeon]
MPPERPLRICIVSPGLMDLYRSSGERQVGGTEVMSDLLARHLAPLAEVHVVTDDPGEPLRTPPYRLHALPLGEALRSRPRVLAGWRYLRRLSRALRAIDPDVLLQHCSGMEAFVMARHARRHGKRFVYHWGADSDLTGLMVPGRPVLAALFRWGRRHADLQLCQTEHQLGLLGEAERRRAVLFPNPLNTRVPWRRS